MSDYDPNDWNAACAAVAEIGLGRVEYLTSHDDTLSQARDRLAFNLRQSGMKYREIGALLGISVERTSVLVERHMQRIQYENDRAEWEAGWKMRSMAIIAEHARRDSAPAESLDWCDRCGRRIWSAICPQCSPVGRS